MATFVIIFVSMLLMASLAYLVRIIWQLRIGKIHFLGSSAASPRLPAWQMSLYTLPLLLTMMFTLAGYLVVQTLYGYNLFEVLLLFRLGVPPGVYISGVSLIMVVFLWVILIAFSALFIRGNRKKPNPPPVSARQDKPV